MVRTLTVDQLALRLGKTKKTIHADMVRRPDALPRWFKLPHGKTVFWLEDTVDAFMLEQARLVNALPTDVKNC